MAASYHIDKDARVVFSTATGTLDLEDAKGHMERILEDPDFNPSFSQLLDFREVGEVALTHNEIVELSTFNVFSSESKRAFLVATPEHFGLARVFQTYRSARGDHTIRVFTDPLEAFAWLGIERHATP